MRLTHKHRFDILGAQKDSPYLSIFQRLFGADRLGEKKVILIFAAIAAMTALAIVESLQTELQDIR